MTSRTKKQRGVQDLNLKLDLSRKLLGAWTETELVEKVLPPKDYGDTTWRVVENLRKWRDHDPTNAEAGKFWQQLAYELECPYTVTGTMLVAANIERFIGYLPDDRQCRAREILADVNSPAIESYLSPESPEASRLIRNLDLDDSNVIWFQHKGPVETIATGVRAGRIDQRHYYLDPDSASAWSRLVNADAYPTYDHCKAGLQALFESVEWNQSLESTRPVTAVMLAGGGAPTKDLLLLRSLLAQPYVEGRIHYYLNDISLHMLRDSVVWIRENLRTLDVCEKVSIELIHGDVLEMTGLRGLFHHQGKVIFGITGGTIGNFSEGAFFRSLNRAADEGDLLVISADTLDGLPQDAIQDTLIGKYDLGYAPRLSA